MIVNEENEIIGLTTLKHINNEKAISSVVGLAIHTGEKAITRSLKRNL